MRIYTHSATQATRPAARTSSAKRRAAFAREAAIDAFGPKAIHNLAHNHARQPDHGPRRLGRVAAKVTSDTGMLALRHWLNQAGRADSDEEREVALKIAAEIARLAGIDIDLIGRRAVP